MYICALKRFECLFYNEFILFVVVRASVPPFDWLATVNHLTYLTIPEQKGNCLCAPPSHPFSKPSKM
jgi:hypothetical protein